MKKSVIILLSLLLAVILHAQDSQTAFNFLRLSTSAHTAALGGENVSLTDDDASMVFQNPSLLYYVSDRTLGLNMMTYMQGSVTGSASYSQLIGERGSWGLQGRFINYGEMKQTTVNNEQTGTFHANDFALGGTYAYGLTEHISGGITAKFISSHIAGYNSLAVGVDLGLNFYDEQHEWSLSAVARNLGGQVKAYDDDFERIPLDLQIGVSKRLAAAPLRFHVTMSRLTEWNDGIGRHFAIGADLLLGQSIYLASIWQRAITSAGHRR